MHVFFEVAQASSFRKAGEVLGIPNSTVSRRIASLEREIGLRLFKRTTRQVSLTEAGQIYLDRCRCIMAQAQLAHQELAELLEQPSGLIRLSVPVDFGVVFLSAQLAQFAHSFPTIHFDLDLTPHQTDLVAKPVDIAIRTGIPSESNLIARPITKLRMGLFASPTYLAAHGLPKSPDELGTHKCLRIDDDPWQLSPNEGGDPVSVAVAGSVMANNVGMLRQLSIHGMGVVMMSRELARPDVSAGRLAPVLSDLFPPPVPIYALTETRLLPAKVRVFLDFLAANLGT